MSKQPADRRLYHHPPNADDIEKIGRQVLDELRPGDAARMTLYYDEGDPRIRNTRLLLEELARDRPDRLRAVAQPGHDLEAGRIGQSVQHDG